LYQANIVVCGLETVTLVEDKALDLNVAKDGGDANFIIAEADYIKYFTFEPGANSNPECMTATYKLVRQNGASFNDVSEDPMISLKDGKILISKLLTTVEP
jgi:hypothetical protein